MDTSKPLKKPLFSREELEAALKKGSEKEKAERNSKPPVFAPGDGIEEQDPDDIFGGSWPV